MCSCMTRFAVNGELSLFFSATKVNSVASRLLSPGAPPLLHPTGLSSKSLHTLQYLFIFKSFTSKSFSFSTLLVLSWGGHVKALGAPAFSFVRCFQLRRLVPCTEIISKYKHMENIIYADSPLAMYLEGMSTSSVLSK
jgi:hypothetical protein